MGHSNEHDFRLYSLVQLMLKIQNYQLVNSVCLVGKNFGNLGLCGRGCGGGEGGLPSGKNFGNNYSQQLSERVLFSAVG